MEQEQQKEQQESLDIFGCVGSPVVNYKDELQLRLNLNNHYASVIKFLNTTSNVFIPSFVEYKGEKYVLHYFERDAFYNFKIDSLSFAEDSQIESFSYYMFCNGSIKKLQIPANLKSLSDFWCYSVKDLTDIEVSPKNELFKYIDGKYLVGKSSKDKKTFDVLYYVSDDIEEAIIPSHVEIIKALSLDSENLKSIICLPDSNLKEIEEHAIKTFKLTKLVLSATLEKMPSNFFRFTDELVDIDINSENQIFKLTDGKFIVKKSEKTSKVFDILCFCCRNAEEVLIPNYIKVISPYAFRNCKQIKSLEFESNSSLEAICGESFSGLSSITSIVLPPTVNEIYGDSFILNDNLQSIKFLGKKISIGCESFNYCSKLSEISFPNATYLKFTPKSLSNLAKKTVIKIRPDVIIIGGEINEIKKQIKLIEDDKESDKSFRFIQKITNKIKVFDSELDELLNEMNSDDDGDDSENEEAIDSLEQNVVEQLNDSIDLIKKHINELKGQKEKHKIDINSNIDNEYANVNQSNFYNILKSLLTEKKENADLLYRLAKLIPSQFFNSNIENSLSELSKAFLELKEKQENISSQVEKLQSEKNSFCKILEKIQNEIPEEIKNETPEEIKEGEENDLLSIHKNIQKLKNRYQFLSDQMNQIKEKLQIDKISDITVKISSLINEESNESGFDKKECIYLNAIKNLESRLNKYEKIDSFDLNLSNRQGFCRENANMNHEEEHSIFIDDEDESHQKVINKIGEGATSIAYKIVDDRNKQIMCKKVLKTDEKHTSFKDFQNIYKEFEVLLRLNHPCICKLIGMNPQEKVFIPSKTEILYEDNDENDYGEEEEEFSCKDSKQPITTIALFLKYHPFNLKEVLNESFFTNTLKAKIVVEIAFGMSHIHSLGMIHRDLKLENVMLNYIFEVQLIDFGLVHVNELMNPNESLTKGIGTLAYMSPEMQNEEKYDNKTDVYSFGVLLFVLFTKHFPKQSMKDKLTNKPIKFPRPSPFISKFCIDLIKKCMSFEPSKRPTFDDILNELKLNSFALADEIDYEIIYQRYLSLTKIK